MTLSPFRKIAIFLPHVSLALLICISTSFGARSKNLIIINDENWTDILQGEWMINFYSRASWCPACKEIERPWNAFADWSVKSVKNKKLKVAQIDVSENPGLSGRFLVTALPTIYHVKDGVFRIYNGPKDKEDFIKFYKQKQWSKIDQLPSWCYPNSVQMSLVASLFKFSMNARDFHNHLVNSRGMPSILSFAVFGTVTLIIGCILGFFMVMVIDHFVPSGKSGKRKQQQQKETEKQSKKDQNNKEKGKEAKNSSHQSTEKQNTKNGSQPKNTTKNGAMTNGVNAENTEISSSKNKDEKKDSKRPLSNDLNNAKNSMDKKRD